MTERLLGECAALGDGGDIGAVEGTGPAIEPLHLVVDSPLDGVDAIPGDGVCATAEAACSLRAAIDETNEHPTADVIEPSGSARARSSSPWRISLNAALAASARRWGPGSPS